MDADILKIENESLKSYILFLERRIDALKSDLEYANRKWDQEREHHVKMMKMYRDSDRVHNSR